MNYYAQAIDVLENLEDGKRMRTIVVAFAKRHPKAFLNAAGGNTSDWKVEARSLYIAGQKVPAIKYCREMTGFGLKEAKEAVEALA